jgi:hypothetical protein
MTRINIVTTSMIGFLALTFSLAVDSEENQR